MKIMTNKYINALILFTFIASPIIQKSEAASTITKEIQLGDTRKSGNTLLGSNVSLKAIISSLNKCQDRWPKVSSNYGYMCLNLEGRDPLKFDLAFAKIDFIDADVYSKLVSKQQPLKVTARVELRENGNFEKFPYLVILKLEPIKELDCEYVSC